MTATRHRSNGVADPDLLDELELLRRLLFMRAVIRFAGRTPSDLLERSIADSRARVRELTEGGTVTDTTTRRTETETTVSTPEPDPLGPSVPPTDPEPDDDNGERNDDRETETRREK